jgi:hypothetical protein
MFSLILRIISSTFISSSRISNVSNAKTPSYVTHLHGTSKDHHQLVMLPAGRAGL